MVFNQERRLYFEISRTLRKDAFKVDFLCPGDAFDFWDSLSNTCSQIIGMELSYGFNEGVTIIGEDGVRFWKDVIAEYIFVKMNKEIDNPFFKCNGDKLVKNNSEYKVVDMDSCYEGP